MFRGSHTPSSMFSNTTKKIVKIMAIDIKTTETVQHRFFTSLLLLFFHAFFIRELGCFIHLEYSNLYLFQFSSTLVLFSDKQMNWASKSVFSLSSIKLSYDLRKLKVKIGMTN